MNTYELFNRKSLYQFKFLISAFTPEWIIDSKVWCFWSAIIGITLSPLLCGSKLFTYCWKCSNSQSSYITQTNCFCEQKGLLVKKILLEFRNLVIIWPVSLICLHVVVFTSFSHVCTFWLYNRKQSSWSPYRRGINFRMLNVLYYCTLNLFVICCQSKQFTLVTLHQAVSLPVFKKYELFNRKSWSPSFIIYCTPSFV